MGRAVLDVVRPFDMWQVLFETPQLVPRGGTQGGAFFAVTIQET